MKQPQIAIIAITHRCNARCIMCDIWKKETTVAIEMQPSEYATLPPGLKDINITGGEPFLREDLPEIIETIRKTCIDCRILVSTNGMLENQIKRILPEVLKKDPSIAIRVSIDALYEKHDEIRGIKGGFSKAISSLAYMKKVGVKDLGIAMTLMNMNENQLLTLLKLSSDIDVEFSVSLVYGSEIYFGKDKSKLRSNAFNGLNELSRLQYNNWSAKRWLRGWYAESLADYAITGTRRMPCYAGKDFFYLDPYAKVFACLIKSEIIGSLRDNDFNCVWNSDSAKRTREKLRGCQDCWMLCSCKSGIMSNRFQFGSKLVAAKLRNHIAG